MEPTTQNPTPDTQPQTDANQNIHFHHHHHCRGGWFPRLFWGLLIIIIGAGLLARSMGFSPNLDWSGILRHLWPVILIFVGLSIMSRGGIASQIVSGIIMLAILALLVVWMFNIPIHAKIGSRQINLEPSTFNNWVQESPGIN